MKRASAIPTLLILLVLTGITARTVAVKSFHRLAAWPAAPVDLILAAPAANQPDQPQRPESALPHLPRLIIILVDGLSADDALRLPMVAHLARQGAYYVAQGPEPAWPVSAWATALTARAPAGHGLLLPGVPRPAPLPNLPALAKAGGYEVAAAGSESFLRLVDLWADRGQFPIPSGWEGTGQPLIEAVTAALNSGADLVLLHLDGLHTIAHRLADNPASSEPQVEWDVALAWTDVRVAQILENIDLGRSAVILAGTYGATAGGRHGSGRATPLIVAGTGAAAGQRGQARLQDVAPIAAAILGLPDTLPKATLPTAPAQTTLQMRLARLWSGVQPRLPWLLFALLLLIIYVWALARQPFGRPLLLSVLLYLVLQPIIFFALGGTYTPDLTGLELLGGTFWWRRFAEAAIPLAIGAFVNGFILGKRGIIITPRPQNQGNARPQPQLRQIRPVYAAVSSLHAALLLAGVLALQIIAVLVYSGWDEPRWPGIGWAIKYFLDLSHVMALAVSAPAAALAAVLGAVVGREAAGDVGDSSREPGRPVVQLDTRRPRRRN